MHTQVFTTLLIFLTSANHEIIKSTTLGGYINLAIHTLPIELLRPHLKELGGR
jgi:ribosomal RNA-processing protein 12